MALEDISEGALRQQLDRVESREATRRLMAAIAHKRGIGTGDLAEWYGIEAAALEAWFDRFDDEGLAAVVDDLERFGMPGRSVPPTARQRGPCRLTYLDHAVVADRGWAVTDDDLFEKAHAADLSLEEYGRIAVEPGETVLESAEGRGLSWPYACRGGACSNCAVVVVEGEIAMSGNHVLPESAVERGARLTCVGTPVSEEVKLVYNARELDYLDELLLPVDWFTEGELHT